MKSLDKKMACMVIGSYLDTLGYKNGLWEFNFNQKVPELANGTIVSYEILHNYYAFGGPNINISKWVASDDTILMIATKNACIKGGKYEDYKKEYLKVLPLLKEDKRGSGIATIESLELLAKNKKIKYDKKYGGNGPASRCAYIGIHNDNIDEIIKQSIISSRMTHNYTMGFLSGLVVALFTHYAYNDINIFEWSTKLIELYENGDIDKYMKTTDIYDEYEKDKVKFFDYFYMFNEEMLETYKYRINDNLYSVSRLAKLEKYLPAIKYSGDYGNMGGSGIGCVIYSYDALLMSYDYEYKTFNYDSLVFFSTLHFGDNDTTGAVCGCWFGALTGFKYFDKEKINMLEFRGQLVI
jgi:ADP-ribosylarginine hydrolase